MSTPEAELEGYSSQFEGNDDQPSPPPVDTATPVTTEAAPSDPFAEIDEDPALPPSLRGKSRREIYDTNKQAIAQANKAGLDKNDSDRRAQILEALNTKLLQQMQERANQQPPAPPSNPLHSFGLSNDEEAYTNLPSVVKSIPQVIKREAEQIADNKLAPVLQDLENLKRQNLFTVAEAARSNAREAVGVDAQTWEAIRPALASLMQANNMDPRDPNAWTQAATFLKSVAPKLVPAPVETKVGAPPTGNGRPGPSTPTAPKKRATTGNARMDEMTREILADYNKGLPDAKKMKFDDIAELVAGDPMRGGGDF